MKILFLLPLFLLQCFTALDQIATPETFKTDPDRAGGIYYSYHYGDSACGNPDAPLLCDVKAPCGYKPYFVNYVGRHASRYHTSPYRYVLCQSVLNDALEAGILTEYGKKLQGIMDRTAKDAEGRDSEISDRGVNEQRAIAERLFKNTGRLFKGRNVSAHSMASSSTRCILTMAAFDSRLSELNPDIRISKTANGRSHMALRAHKGCESFQKTAQAETLAEIEVPLRAMSDNVLNRIFLPGTCPFASDRDKVSIFVRSLFDLALIAQDYDGERFYDLFTPDEIYAMWVEILKYRYAQYGNSERWGDAILGDGMLLMKYILENVQSRIDGDEDVAALMFGHDYTVLALLNAMQVEGPVSRRTADLNGLKDWWMDYLILPMSTNVQFIFYRNSSGDVIVKIAHNERVVKLSGVPEVFDNFYRWEDLKSWMESRVAYIDSLPAVRALNFDAPVMMKVPAFGSLPSKYGN